MVIVINYDYALGSQDKTTDDPNLFDWALASKPRLQEVKRGSAH